MRILVAATVAAINGHRMERRNAAKV